MQIPQVLDAIQLSHATFNKIKQNLWWAFGYNLVGIPLAAGALLPSMGIALTPSISGTASAPPAYNVCILQKVSTRSAASLLKVDGSCAEAALFDHWGNNTLAANLDGRYLIVMNLSFLMLHCMWSFATQASL